MRWVASLAYTFPTSFGTSLGIPAGSGVFTLKSEHSSLFTLPSTASAQMGWTSALSTFSIIPRPGWEGYIYRPWPYHRKGYDGLHVLSWNGIKWLNRCNLRQLLVLSLSQWWNFFCIFAQFPILFHCSKILAQFCKHSNNCILVLKCWSTEILIKNSTTKILLYFIIGKS